MKTALRFLSPLNRRIQPTAVQKGRYLAEGREWPITVLVALFGGLLAAVMPARADVISTVNIDSVQTNQNPSGTSFFLQYNKPASPVEPFFQVKSATVHATIASSDILTFSLWGVTGVSSTKLSGDILSAAPTGTADITTDLTGLGTYAYSSYDSVILQVLGATANYSTATGAYTFTSSNTNVVLSGSYVSSNSGGTPAPGPHYLWMNTTVAAVPEPGTLLLGAMAFFGGAGGMWVRRSNKKEGANSKIQRSGLESDIQ